MQRGKKIAAAVVMLGLGLGTAMLFRRADAPPTSSHPVPPVPQKEALILRESHGEVLSGGSAKGAIALKPGKKQRPPRDLNDPIAAPRKRILPPPDLPAVFDRTLSGPPSDDPRGVAALAKLEALQSIAQSNNIPQGPPQLRVHRIVDGDTLARLAERFLGDANRQAEIHALNEAQLPDPNLLPIGVELKIPPRDGSPLASTSPQLSSVPLGAIAPPSLPVPSEGLPVGIESPGLVPVPVGQPHE